VGAAYPDQSGYHDDLPLGAPTMFDWEELRYFAAFARTGSLAAAARLLSVDHTTIARRITALEKSLSVKLVDRRPKSYVLTEDGARVAAFAEDMNHAAFALERFVKAGQDGVHGEVVLSSPPAFLGALIAPHVGALLAQHPGLRLRLVGTKGSISLSRREADVSLGFVRPTEPTLVAKRLGKLGFRLYASPEYVSSGREAVYIGYDNSMKGSPQQAWLEARAGERPIIVCSNDLRIQAAAAAGHAGVVLLPDFLAAQHGLVRFDAKDAALKLEIWLSVHEDVRRTERIRAVVDFVVRCIAPVQGM
jgi:DNA-binding transcriptional LysR family regulator